MPIAMPWVVDPPHLCILEYMAMDVSACASTILLMVSVALLMSVLHWTDVLMLSSMVSTCVACGTMSTGAASTSWCYLMVSSSILSVWAWSIRSSISAGNTHSLIPLIAIDSWGQRVWGIAVLVLSMGLPCYWYGVAKLELATTCTQGLHTGNIDSCISLAMSNE